MITRIKKKKQEWNTFYVIVNANLIVQNVIQIKNEKMICVDANVRGNLFVKKILAHAALRLMHVSKVLSIIQ